MCGRLRGGGRSFRRSRTPRSAARCHPVREPLVQIGAVRFQQAAVGDVADEHVVEAPDRFVTDVGPARLGEFEPAKSVEGQVDSRPRRCRPVHGRRQARSRCRPPRRSRGRADRWRRAAPAARPEGHGLSAERRWRRHRSSAANRPAPRRARRHARASRSARARTVGCLRWTTGGDAELVGQPGGAEHVGGHSAVAPGSRPLRGTASDTHRPTRRARAGSRVARAAPGPAREPARHAAHSTRCSMKSSSSVPAHWMSSSSKQSRSLRGQHLDEPAQRPEVLLDRSTPSGGQAVEVAQQPIPFGNACGNIAFEIRGPQHLDDRCHRDRPFRRRTEPRSPASGLRRVNSAASRLLPTPGSPMTVTNRAARRRPRCRAPPAAGGPRRPGRRRERRRRTGTDGRATGTPPRVRSGP